MQVNMLLWLLVRFVLVGLIQFVGGQDRAGGG